MTGSKYTEKIGRRFGRCIICRGTAELSELEDQHGFLYCEDCYNE